MSADPDAHASCRIDHRHCITCGDEGVPMTVIEPAADGTAAVCADENGQRHEVATDLVDRPRAGDTLLVHAGVAIGALGPTPSVR